MSRLLFVTICLASLTALTSCCYDECIHKFSQAVGKAAKGVNSTVLTENFCRAMSQQISCLHNAVPTCGPEQKALIQSMLNIFIQPDYQRTCSRIPPMNMTHHVTPAVPSVPGGPTMIPTMMPTSPINSQLLLVCTQKIKQCQSNFNKTFTGNMAAFNISGLCQSLKLFTLCFVNLLSSECGHFVPRNLISSMQQQYGGMCSTDAQANTHTMLECTNKTMQCYIRFNATFSPAVADYNLVHMCGSIDNYTKCMQSVSLTSECSQYTSQSLAGIARLKLKHNAYCGDDNGMTAHQCVEQFQDCYVPFNMTFFPALHTANLSLLCTSLSRYTSCVTRLSPVCSRQLGQVLKSVQALKLQYSQKCHPKILKLAECDEVGTCSKRFLSGFTTNIMSSEGLCGSIGDYFPCVSTSLDQCNLPQSTTEVAFGDLGTLMKGYCDKISSNVKLLQCPTFLKCSAAILVSFTPNMKNMFEGSTWCTFMQLSIGCAEHALQSAGCFLEGDQTLQRYIGDLDTLRVRTCEKDASYHGDDENVVDLTHQSVKGGNDKDSANALQGRTTWALVSTLSLLHYIRAH